MRETWISCLLHAPQLGTRPTFGLLDGTHPTQPRPLVRAIGLTFKLVHMSLSLQQMSVETVDAEVVAELAGETNTGCRKV